MKNVYHVTTNELCAHFKGFLASSVDIRQRYMVSYNTNRKKRNGHRKKY